MPARTHGEGNKTSEYAAWKGMKARCLKGGVRYGKYYKDRGIKICERWIGSDGYSNFLSDMGRRPSPKHSIDRINNDGNYEPSNCRWATMLEQNRNKGPRRLRQHCKRGHVFDESNTYHEPPNGVRKCRACGAMRSRGYARIKRATQAADEIPAREE